MGFFDKMKAAFNNAMADFTGENEEAYETLEEMLILSDAGMDTTEDIMEKLRFAPGEMLVLDDLKPGYDMARAANVPFAAALWSNDIPEIEAFMRGNCGLCFKTIAQFRDYLFSGKEA